MTSSREKRLLIRKRSHGIDCVDTRRKARRKALAVYGLLVALFLGLPCSSSFRCR